MSTTVPDLFTEQESDGLLESILDDSREIFVKKLSVNDRDWSWRKDKHQNGVYILRPERDSGFFPLLASKVREQAGSHEIRETFFDIAWPAIGEVKRTRLVHYTGKGQETHLTRLPKQLFRDLAPASMLVIGRCDGVYKAITVDSENPDYDLLHDFLSLPPDFCSAIFTMSVIRADREAKAISFVDDVVKAFFEGRIKEFSKAYEKMPESAYLATLARTRFMTNHEMVTLNPFAMGNPGDALREISRGIEYEIFKEHQGKVRALQLIKEILGDDPGAVTIETVIRAIVVKYPEIDRILLSASQQRKSRACQSFELHIEAMLQAGNVPFMKQVVLDLKKRPDFILPSLDLYVDPSRTDKLEALVLSAKTTLRERWKQVGVEIKNCELYLATVDENIAANAIQDMASQGIKLVVPESLKTSKTTEYNNSSSVISFKTFFENDIAMERWPLWMARGIVAARS